MPVANIGITTNTSPLVWDGQRMLLTHSGRFNDSLDRLRRENLHFDYQAEPFTRLMQVPDFSESWTDEIFHDLQRRAHKLKAQADDYIKKHPQKIQSKEVDGAVQNGSAIKDCRVNIARGLELSFEASKNLDGSNDIGAYHFTDKKTGAKFMVNLPYFSFSSARKTYNFKSAGYNFGFNSKPPVFEISDPDIYQELCESYKANKVPDLFPIRKRRRQRKPQFNCLASPKAMVQSAAALIEFVENHRLHKTDHIDFKFKAGDREASLKTFTIDNSSHKTYALSGIPGLNRKTARRTIDENEFKVILVDPETIRINLSVVNNGFSNDFAFSLELKSGEEPKFTTWQDVPEWFKQELMPDTTDLQALEQFKARHKKDFYQLYQSRCQERIAELTENKTKEPESLFVNYEHYEGLSLAETKTRLVAEAEELLRAAIDEAKLRGQGKTILLSGVLDDDAKAYSQGSRLEILYDDQDQAIGFKIHANKLIDRHAREDERGMKPYTTKLLMSYDCSSAKPVIIKSNLRNNKKLILEDGNLEFQTEQKSRSYSLAAFSKPNTKLDTTIEEILEPKGFLQADPEIRTMQETLIKELFEQIALTKKSVQNEIKTGRFKLVCKPRSEEYLVYKDEEGYGHFDKLVFHI